MTTNRNETGCDTLRTQLPGRGQVLIVCPGGLEHGGGIGRQMGYFLLAREDVDTGPIYRLIDSRGPWFLGSSPWRAGQSVFYLAASAAALVGARFSRAPALAHINITGRGSTLRKVVLSSIACMVGLPYLLHVHDYDYVAEFRSRGGVMQSLIRRVFRGARQVLVLGCSARDELVRSLSLPDDLAIVLHNAVPDPPRASVPQPAGAACGVLFLGHLSARKGVPDLLRALASPSLADLAWHATLAGGGPIGEYQALASELGISDHVTFPGWCDQAAVSALFADAQILTLPSYAEGLAMAVLEGLSYGLAIVATPVGAHAEVIEPGASGLFVPPGDVEALAAALARVIQDDALRQHLRDGARRRFLDGFEIHEYSRRLAEIHTTLLGEPVV